MGSTSRQARLGFPSPGTAWTKRCTGWFATTLPRCRLFAPRKRHQHPDLLAAHSNVLSKLKV